jgi:hypothetical protein
MCVGFGLRAPDMQARRGMYRKARFDDVVVFALEYVNGMKGYIIVNVLKLPGSRPLPRIPRA